MKHFAIQINAVAAFGIHHCLNIQINAVAAFGIYHCHIGIYHCHIAISY